MPSAQCTAGRPQLTSVSALWDEASGCAPFRVHSLQVGLGSDATGYRSATTMAECGLAMNKMHWDRPWSLTGRGEGPARVLRQHATCNRIQKRLAHAATRCNSIQLFGPPVVDLQKEPFMCSANSNRLICSAT
jgi:hypothetical protein